MKRILLIIFLMLFIFFADVLATVPVYESFDEGKAIGTSVTVTKPSGVVEGDLLIGCLSSDGGSETHTSPEADSWNVIYKGLTEGSNKQTFSIWWKTATAGEPADYTFGCGSSEGLYAWVMRISGQHSTYPIHKQDYSTGDSTEVSCPSVSTEFNDCLIIRSFGLDSIDVTVDGGWGSETNITVDLSDGAGGAAGGSAWKNQPTAGGTGAETNTLTATEEWVGVTIAIRSIFEFIDIGSPAIVRTGNLAPYTVINKTNPANRTGKITSVEIWCQADLSNCEVATFYVVSGNNLSTRDTHTIGSVTAGSKQTFSGLAIDVQIGDYIGMYYSSGIVWRSGSGYDDIWLLSGDNIPCTDVTFEVQPKDTMSLYGIGVLPGWPHKWNSITIGKWNTKEIMKWN